MRAVYWKELRELAVFGLPLAFIAMVVAAGREDRLDALFQLALLSGVVLGVVQGRLDRVRRDDLFLLHRPLSVLRLHGARTLAGATVGAAVVLAGVGARRLFADDRWAVLGKPEPGPDATGIILLLAALLAAWAIFRLVLLPRRWGAVLAALLFLPVLTHAWASRIESIALASVAGLALCLACTSLTLLQLAGDTP